MNADAIAAAKCNLVAFNKVTELRRAASKLKLELLEFLETMPVDYAPREVLGRTSQAVEAAVLAIAQLH